MSYNAKMNLSAKTADRIVLLLSMLILFLVSVILFRDSFTAWLQSELNQETRVVIPAPPDNFLVEEEVVVVASSTADSKVELLPIEKVLFEYVEVVDSCREHYEGDCLVVRSGPGTEYPVLLQLRNGIVLKVGGVVEHGGMSWYKIVFDEWLRYPERVKGDWYVAADFVQILRDEGDKTIWEHDYATTTIKTITVDRSEQMLYAFEGNQLFMETSISTGLELTPTPRGTFMIYKKTPSRYMQGPLPNLSDRQYYDLPGVPWNLYFTEGGAVIHGAYWHDSFGSQYSHGCVNLPPRTAHELYNWAELGTVVIVKD